VSALNWEKNKRNQERSQRVRDDRPRARISVKGQQPPTDKQLSYLRDLARQLGRDMPDAGASAGRRKPHHPVSTAASREGRWAQPQFSDIASKHPLTSTPGGPLPW
jgi:hypothetical protein